ncbi:hypothetical protein CAPTEDRAFT_20779 [Capitella teleta]|uniref:Uncharacterized protein n=1 Tax=Capitella teleta TaxID=283909 RepID=R7UWZ6_CAPTE|nr:hypothetical protein CAPTEDRAFT_20779 [Capitella teleta]|eukprot:ELU08442.1 hypothetical protein CAPTEDRAFT_20779 [Capitella teleta]
MISSSLDLISLAFAGEIPKWINGSLYRNGPGKFKQGGEVCSHLFDGMSAIHHFSLQDGCVQYQNTLLNSDAFRMNEAARRLICPGFAAVSYPDPCKSIFSRYFSYFTSKPPNDNCSVNLMQLGDQFYAMTETNTVRKIDPKTLETPGKVDMTAILSMHMATAHPLVDVNGDTYNMGTRFGKDTSYVIMKVPPPEPGCAEPLENRQLVCSVPAHRPSYPSYFHSFGMTENYIILVEQPLVTNVFKLLARRFINFTYKDTLNFHPEERVRIHLVNKSTGERLTQSYTTDAFFLFHHLNSYEEDNCVVFDVVAYPNADIIEDLMMENIRTEKVSLGNLPQLTRLVLPLNTPADVGVGENIVNLAGSTATAAKESDGNIHCVPQRFSDCCIELPRWNEKFNGKKYKFAYAVTYKEYLLKDLKLSKVNVDTGEMKVWGEDDYLAGEPVFIPSPNAVEEDDGVILSPLVSVREDKPCLLVILDAKTFTEIARARIPSWTPFTLHGIFAEGY